MMAANISGGAISYGLAGKPRKRIANTGISKPLPFIRPRKANSSLDSIDKKGLGYSIRIWHNYLSAKHGTSLSSAVPNYHQNRCFLACCGKVSSDCNVNAPDVNRRLKLDEELPASNDANGALLCSKVKQISIHQNQYVDVRQELLNLSLPAIAGQALDPLAQLMETAYIGGLGPVELASAGISINIFNYVSKLFNIPLLSVATSFVAEDIAKNANEDPSSGSFSEYTNGKPGAGVSDRRQLSSVSTALLLAVGIGLFEALGLSLGSGLFLDAMGISSESSMRIPAQKFLLVRSLGAPAVVLSLALQGIFRGFKDTKTPVLCLGIGNLLAVCMFPISMYCLQLGATGAAISTVASQYVVTILMLWFLNKRAILLPPKMGALQFGVYFKSGGFLIGRTLAVLITMTLGTRMAARQGAVAMAAHQICMQVWLAVSLLTDALAASGQALIASSMSREDYANVKKVTDFVLKIGVLTGISLAVILGFSFSSLSTLFTKDAEVLQIVRTGILFVSASQPLTALAYIFDGLHYGVSDFYYAAYSMMTVGAISSTFLLCVPSNFGLPGVWLGLTLFMGLRMLAGYLRLLSRNGPWWFLHSELR